VLLAGVPATVAPVMLSQIDEIRSELDSLEASLSELITHANLLGIPLLPTMGEEQDFFTILYEPQRIFGVLLAATENLAWILIILVTTFYFMLDGERLRNWVYKQVPQDYQYDLRRLHRSLQEIWQAYLRGQLLLMFTIGLMTWIMGMAVGLRGSLLIGILAGALDVIPSLGPAVAMVIAGVVAYFEGSTFLPLSRVWFTVLVVGLFMGIQVVENVWLRPRIFSKSLRLHPAVVFVAIVGALALAGVVAALVVVPLISSVRVLARFLLRKVMGENPWAEEETQALHQAEVRPAAPVAPAAGEDYLN
jgi:predicted PurR-regulated permease PerM